jgi:hypothetical protein
MPEVRLEPLNQCLVDGSSAAEEAAASPPSAPEPTAAFGGTDGAEGGSGTGSAALVQRFTGDGAGGAPGASGALSATSLSCTRETLSAVGSCGGALLRARDPVALVFALAACAGSLLGLDECTSKGD